MEWEEDYTQPSDPLSQIRAAQAMDEKERRRREAMAEIRHGLDMVIQRRTNVARPQAQPFDDNLKAFLLSRKAQGEDADRAWRQSKPGIEAEARAARDAQTAEQRAADREAERQWREEQAERDRKFRAGENEKDRGVRRETARTASESRETVNEGRKADQKRKEEEAASKRYISEDFTETAQPLPPPVLADLQKRAASTRVVLENADALEKLLEGGPKVYGQNAAQMEMLANNIWTELKDIKGLGVLAGPDMGILQGILGDPTQLRSILRERGKDRDFRALVAKFKERMKADMVQRVKGYGAIPTPRGLYAPPEPPPPAAGAPASPGTMADGAARKILNGRVYEKRDGQWFDLGPEVK